MYSLRLPPRKAKVKRVFSLIRLLPFLALILSAAVTHTVIKEIISKYKAAKPYISLCIFVALFFLNKVAFGHINGCA